MKRIVICADGTWNSRDQVDEESGKRRPTNVTKVARTVLSRSADAVDQLVFYDDGVGTAGGLDRFTGGAFGDGICMNVVQLYRNILYNYNEGDRLFFFGFSRGAFTVRTLTGFLHKFGLLKKDCDYFLPEVFALYEKNLGWDSAPGQELRPRVKGVLPCPEIEFVGVWDTVGSLGAPGFLGRYLNGNKYQFHDVSLVPEIRHAYHALAIDEHRGPFQPTLWKRPPDWAGELIQAWFAGVHSNIGGSYNPDGLANEALHWIVEKAENLGLAFDKAALEHYMPCYNSVMKDSMTAMYKLMGRYLRPIGKQLEDGEVVHKSAVDRWHHDASKYQPANLKPLMAGGACSISVVNTTRVMRDRECPPLIVKKSG